MTLPPMLPVSVTAPPEVSSTKFETVAFMVTEPVVCADAATAVIVIKAVIASAFRTLFVDLNMVVGTPLWLGMSRLKSAFVKKTEGKGL